MEHVPLGSSGLMVSRLGYGCGGLSSQPSDDAASAVVLRHALELGVTFFDTGDGDGKGHNEALVGRVFAGRADDLVLAIQLDGTEHVQAACDASLRRLGLDVIDLCYLQRVGAAFDVEETVGAMAELVAAGKVRALGLSDTEPAAIRRAHSVHPITALQMELSLWVRGGEEQLEVCRELGITFVARGPLGIGLLTGDGQAAEDAPSGSPVLHDHRVGPGDIHRNGEILAKLRQVAEEVGCSPRQLALAWVLAKGNDVVPIPGTRDASRLERNLAGLHVTPSPGHLRSLDALFQVGARSGRRKSTAMLEIVNS